MDPIELVALMAASLRAGKAGKQAVAWGEAVSEAVYGLSLILHNEAGLRAQLQAAIPKPVEQEPLVRPVGGLLVPS